jgi:hypothetical protein
MMRKTIIALGLSLSVASPSLAAIPTTPVVGGTNVMTVAGGCGLGWHRGPYGGCRRNGYYAPGPAVVVVHPYYRPHCWRGPYGALHCN